MNPKLNFQFKLVPHTFTVLVNVFFAHLTAQPTSLRIFVIPSFPSFITFNPSESPTDSSFTAYLKYIHFFPFKLPSTLSMPPSFHFPSSLLNSLFLPPSPPPFLPSFLFSFLPSFLPSVTEQRAHSAESQTLTAGVCSKVRIYLQEVKQGGWAAHAQKTQLPNGFQARVFKEDRKSVV